MTIHPVNSTKHKTLNFFQNICTVLYCTIALTERLYVPPIRDSWLYLRRKNNGFSHHQQQNGTLARLLKYSYLHTVSNAGYPGGENIVRKENTINNF